jgi:hypothetical protein
MTLQLLSTPTVILQARLPQAKHEHVFHQTNFTVINNTPLFLLSHTRHITVFFRLSRVVVGGGVADRIAYKLL